MMDMELAPYSVRGVNAAYERHVEKLVNQMKRDGWKGRPLLVEEVQQFHFKEYYAWTGSHRIEAAKRAGIATIPCRVLTKQEADEAFFAAGYRQYGFSCWREAVTSKEGAFDKHRLAGLVRAKLEEAADMLREEIRLQDESPHDMGVTPHCGKGSNDEK